MKIYLLAAALCLISVAYAQESTGETQSIRCSALAHIHTAITTPPEFSQAMANSATFYSGVFVAFREDRTGATSNNGEIGQRRDTVEVELRNTWQSKPDVVVGEMALCNTWRANYAEKLPAYLAETRSGDASAQSLVRLVGVPPTLPASGQVEKWRPIVAMAFSAWAKTGLNTGGEAREALKKKL